MVIADVSEFQQTIDWAAYGAAVPGVIIRAHNGARPDKFWIANCDGARKHVAWRGFYQYLPAGVDPVAAARMFQATTGPLLPGEVAILDLEEGSGDQRARRQAWLDTLQDEIEWTYSGLAFARAHLPGIRVEWLAAYGQGEPVDAHDLWQFTNARTFPGIASPCDASIFHGATLPAAATSTTTDQEDDMITLILWCYAQLVGRTAPPSTAEVENWVTGTPGWTAAQVVNGFLAADAEPGSVVKAYYDYLGGAPESDAVVAERLASKPTIRQVRLAIAQSPEATTWATTHVTNRTPPPATPTQVTATADTAAITTAIQTAIAAAVPAELVAALSSIRATTTITTGA